MLISLYSLAACVSFLLSTQESLNQTQKRLFRLLKIMFLLELATDYMLVANYLGDFRTPDPINQIFDVNAHDVRYFLKSRVMSFVQIVRKSFSMDVFFRVTQDLNQD